MNNTEHFGKLTERMQAFREEVLDAKPYIDAQRAVLATEAYKENQNQPRVMVRALMLQKILEGMSISPGTPSSLSQPWRRKACAARRSKCIFCCRALRRAYGTAP